MRLQQYLTERTRSNKISQTDALEWIKTNAKDALKNTIQGKRPIYRGAFDDKGETLIINPSKFERESAYIGSNYYTLLMDNLPSWKDYPKRSKSIVCTTSREKSEDYGNNTFIVFPKDGSKIGICKGDDIYVSFKYLLKQLNIEYLYEFSDNMKTLDYTISGRRSDTSWKSMLKLFKIIDLKEEEVESTIIRHRFNFLYSSKSSKESFNIAISPVNNGFKLVNTKTKLPKNREVWTDGESVMVTEMIFNGWIDEGLL